MEKSRAGHIAICFTVLLLLRLAAAAVAVWLCFNSMFNMLPTSRSLHMLVVDLFKFLSIENINELSVYV